MKGVEEKTEAEPAGPDPEWPDAWSQAQAGACAPGSELRPVLERREMEALLPTTFVIGRSHGV